jgi:hypothetical protein
MELTDCPRCGGMSLRGELCPKCKSGTEAVKKGIGAVMAGVEDADKAGLLAQLDQYHDVITDVMVRLNQMYEAGLLRETDYNEAMAHNAGIQELIEALQDSLRQS